MFRVHRKRSPGSEKIWKIAAVAAMVFVIALLVYANTLLNDFIWDDEYLILHNPQIKSFTHIGNVFRTYVGYGSGNINNFYRPLQEISNMCDYALWGEEPAGFHFTNIILHAIVSVLVYIFLLCVTKDMMAAAIAAIIYAVHPVHTEAVAYIAGRADPLYAIFMLASLILFARYAAGGEKAIRLYILSLYAFVASLLSKEMAVITPVMISLYVLFFIRTEAPAEEYRSLKWKCLPYFVVAAVYGLIRLTALNFVDPARAARMNVTIPVHLRLVTFFRSIGIYLKLIAAPVDLHMERVLPVSRSVLEITSVMGLILAAALCWGVWFTYRRNRLVSFAIAWFLICLLPLSNIVPINSFIAEHWLYMASVGPFLLVGVWVAWAGRRLRSAGRGYRLAFFLAVGMCLSVYAGMTVIRNGYWRDEITFYNDMLKYNPGKARIHLNLGNTHYENGNIDKAIDEYKKVLGINGNSFVACGNIGSAYLFKGDVDEAEKYLKRAISMEDNYPVGHYNLGIIHMKKKQYREAVSEFSVATRQRPQFYQAWNILGEAYLGIGDQASAREAFQRSLAILPDQPAIKRALRSTLSQ